MKKLSQETRRVSKVRVSVVREGDFGKASTPADANRIAFEFMPEGIDREMFFALMLDTRNVVTAATLVSIGTLTGSLVHPREVFKAAIIENAAAVVVVHNHPSGDVSPSQEDREVTRRLVKAGELLGIPVLDHLILGHDGNFYSFNEAGAL